MKISQTKAVLATTMLVLFGTSAFANTVSLTPLTSTVAIGESVVFDLYIDFLQPTVGGSLDIFYDSDILSFRSIYLDKHFWTNVADPAFGVLPDDCFNDGASISGCEIGDAEINSLGFGSFDGISGEHFVGTVTFVALSLGLGTAETAESDGVFGEFISAANASSLTVVYNGASVLVVPIPAAIWMMFGAIGVLGMLRRR